MQQVLSAATTNWSENVDAPEAKYPLPFMLNSEEYVSLRVLLPEKTPSKKHQNNDTEKKEKKLKNTSIRKAITMKSLIKPT